MGKSPFPQQGRVIRRYRPISVRLDPSRVQGELGMGRIHTTGLTIAAAATMFIGAAPAAHADPPICGSPDRPCAGPSPLTPEQQCAFTAWRTMMPCNWLGQQVPQGTPGSWG